MNNKKQTAVNYLVDKWVIKGTIYSEDIENALEMEKEQIIDACDYGKECLFKGKYLKTEQYYKETYE